jgi:beta-glucosidase
MRLMPIRRFVFAILLVGFVGILKPGESKRVSVALDRRAFSYYDVRKRNWNADPDTFGILVGSSSEKIELQGTFVLAP